MLILTCRNEVFGPTTLLVRYESAEQILEVARGLEGHLTAAVLGTDEDFATHRDLIAILERKVGRLIFNGYPTGVEVCDCHGSRRALSGDIGRSLDVCWLSSYLPLRQAGLLPEFAARSTTGGTAGQEPSSIVAHGQRQNDA